MPKQQVRRSDRLPWSEEMRRAPAQRFERELLDRPIDDIEALRGNLCDMALANRLLLSNRSVLRQIERWLSIRPATTPATILDVATGIGGLPWAIERWARRCGYRVRLIASDLDATIIAIARQMLGRREVSLVRHDALRIPFGDHSIDIVTCAFSLHHFPRAAAAA